MDLIHRFTLATSVDNTWAIFNRLEHLEPCFPGASFTTIEGDHFAGSVKIKMGPVGLVYEGSGRVTKRDDRRRRLHIRAEGADRRGYSDGTAVVTASFTGDDAHTDVEVHTDLTLTGQPTQLGEGVIDDISQRIMHQFVSCMSLRLSAGLTAAARPGAPAQVAGTTTLAQPPTVRLGPAPEHLHLGRVAAPVLLRRAAPVLAAASFLALVVAIARRLRNR